MASGLVDINHAKGTLDKISREQCTNRRISSFGLFEKSHFELKINPKTII